MKVFVGIDLGSTTSKALVLDERGEILGRGITNSRSNYDVAVDVARTDAFTETRFNLLGESLEGARLGEVSGEEFRQRLKYFFQLELFNRQLKTLEEELFRHLDHSRYDQERVTLRGHLETIVSSMFESGPRHFESQGRASHFFRDLASSDYMEIAEETGSSFEALAGLFDKAILLVENTGQDLSFEGNIRPAIANSLNEFSARLGDADTQLEKKLETAVGLPIEVAGNVGTGYGRARLPFDEKDIRNEILCHGLGAHAMFPETATVLDIGGQDTKAIQVDEDGIVASFQMNDRCAAGCGRYLGYIADEMNLGLHELGPMACESKCAVKINSTCTVFAGAELRDRLTIGQKREDILAGLHRAIVLRAMSLLARSGGVRNQFTFTGGVANNIAAVKALTDAIYENYGEIDVNISPDSIYTGALGAALYSLRDAQQGGGQR